MCVPDDIEAQIAVDMFWHVQDDSLQVLVVRERTVGPLKDPASCAPSKPKATQVSDGMMPQGAVAAPKPSAVMPSSAVAAFISASCRQVGAFSLCHAKSLLC